MTTYTDRPSAQTPFTTGISGTTIATGSNSALSNTLDNSGATRAGHLALELAYSFGTNPTATKALDVYIEEAKDGTNFEDASPPLGWIHRILVTADTSAHRVALPDIVLRPVAYRVRIVNVDTAQTVTVTLTAATWNDTIE
jgi:hypothetical protein